MMSIKFKLPITIVLLAILPLSFVLLMALKTPGTPAVVNQTIMLCLIITLLISTGTALFINSKVVHPLNQLKTALTRAQQGDLDFNNFMVDSQDEMGLLSNFIKQFMGKVRKTVGLLSGDIEKLRDSSDFLLSMSGQTVNEHYNSVTVNQLNNNVARKQGCPYQH